MHHQTRFLTAVVLAFSLAGAALAASPAGLFPFDERVHREILVKNKGSVLLVDFWATWCAPCREEMPQLVALEKKLRGRGFRLITVSADEPEDKTAALEFLRQHGVPDPAYLKNVDDDDAFITAIDKEWSGALPALFLYDRQGNLVRKFIGETKIEILERAVRDLL